MFIYCIAKGLSFNFANLDLPTIMMAKGIMNITSIKIRDFSTPNL